MLWPPQVALAEELNGAMLACRGLPATSPLERLYQQLSVVVSELKRTDHPQVHLGGAARDTAAGRTVLSGSARLPERKRGCATLMLWFVLLTRRPRCSTVYAHAGDRAA